MKVHNWVLLLLIPSVYAEKPVSDNDLTDKLWLPISYQEHFTTLLKAAKKVQKDPDCKTLLEGSLVEHKTTSERLFFKFSCRSYSGQVFPLYVDGNTFKVRNMLAEARKKEKEKKQRDKELQRAKDLASNEYWKACEKVFKQKTRLFEGLDIKTTLPPLAILLAKGGVKYTVYFDATSTFSGNTLNYKAMATAPTTEECEVIIKPI